MFWIILFIIAVLVVIYMVKRAQNKSEMAFSCLILMTSVLICIAIASSITTKTFYKPKKIELTQTEIVSLSADSQIHGSFILGTGRVNEESVYYIYEKVNRTDYILTTLEASKCVIRESSKQPTVITYRNQYKWSWFSTPMKSDNYYIIRVPQNTLVKNFNP